MHAESTEILMLGFSAAESASVRRILSALTQHYGLRFRCIDEFSGLPLTDGAHGTSIVIANDGSGSTDVKRVTERCRQLAGKPPVVFFPANGHDENAAHLIEYGADDRLFELRRTIWSHLRRLRPVVPPPLPLRVAQATQIGERLSCLLHISTDAIVAADRSSNIIFFNKGAERVFGHAASEIIGLPFSLLVPSFDDDVARFRGARSGDDGAIGIGECGELLAYRKDGEAFPAEVSLAVLDEDGGAVCLAILRDVGAKKRVAEQVEYLATHDSLTGLPNRRLFFDRLSRAIDVAESNEKLMALMFIDLDGFKQVNDVLGHAAGDELLHVVAGRIRAQLRAADTVARLGGDEFAVIIEHLEHVDPISELASALLRALAEPITIEQATTTVSASIGIVICPLEAKSCKQMMVDADRAMYAAKAAGKGRFLFYSADMANAPEFDDADDNAPAFAGTLERVGAAQIRDLQCA